MNVQYDVTQLNGLMSLCTGTCRALGNRGAVGKWKNETQNIDGRQTISNTTSKHVSKVSLESGCYFAIINVLIVTVINR